MVGRKEHGTWHLSLTRLFPASVFMGESFNLAGPATSPSSENGNNSNMNMTMNLHQKKCNHSFVHQVHLLSTYRVSDTVLGAGDMQGDETQSLP